MPEENTAPPKEQVKTDEQPPLKKITEDYNSYPTCPNCGVKGRVGRGSDNPASYLKWYCYGCCHTF